MKILVVDDELNIREALKEFLTKEGYEVSTAEDGRVALEKFKTDKYDIVFMDVKMPGIDGVEAFRQIKQTNPETKVIIISGLPDDTTFDRAVTIAPDAVEGFLPKPFRPEDIRKCLAKISAGGRYSIFQLNEKQSEALDKLSHVCSENVSTAFTQILQKETKTALQKVKVLPLQMLTENVPEKEQSSVCMSIMALGQIAGKIVINFSWQHGLNLVDILQKREIGSTRIFDEKSRGALVLAANILSGAYLNSITQMLGVSTQPSMPEIIFERKNEILNSLTKEFTPITSDTKYIFTVQTILSIVETNIQFEIIFVPRIDSLKIILQKLGALQ